VIQLLLEAGAEIAGKDNYRHTPLMYAVEDGRIDAAKALLQTSAKLLDGPEAQSASGKTVLHYAAMNGHRDVIQLLLAARAEIATKECKGIPPLF